MKKIVFSGFLVATVLAVSAQDITLYRSNNPNPTTRITTTTVVVPQYIESQFAINHPGITVIEWEPMDTWWKASYRTDDGINYVFYNEAGSTFNLALPVLHNSVPQEVVSRAIEQYGPALYGLSTLKDATGNTIYGVHLIENGHSRMTWMNSQGSAVDESSVFIQHADGSVVRY